MTGLEKHLAVERVRLDAPVRSREEVLSELASLLAGPDETAREAVHDDLVRREQLGTTGVGGGIAFPHARVAPLPGIRMAFLRTAAPVDFDALDERPVDLFLAVAGPENDRREYLAVLGTLSYLFRSDAVRDLFRRAADPADVVARLGELSREASRRG